jgi:hypothetical protein
LFQRQVLLPFPARPLASKSVLDSPHPCSITISGSGICAPAGSVRSASSGVPSKLPTRPVHTV